MKLNELPSYDYLFDCLDYYPDSGDFIWRVRPVHHFSDARSCKITNTQFAGTHAGKLRNGYIVITLDGISYRAHRIAWKMMTGEEPPELIDHRNRKRHDNRFKNLRIANKAQNGRNARTPSNNTSGVKGVTWDASRQKWKIFVSARGHTIQGRFDTLKAAEHAAKKARAQLHAEFACSA